MSVEIITKFFTPLLAAASASVLVPNTLLRIASPELLSAKGTCLWAAA